MRTQLLGLPLKQAEAILSEEGVSSAGKRNRTRRAAKSGTEATLRVVYRLGRRQNSSWPRGFSTRFPIRNRKQTDTAGFVGAALCEARLLD